MDTETKTYKLSELYPDIAAKTAQRLHIKKDEIPLVRKYFVSDKDSVRVDEKERSVVSRISCVNVDRDGDSLLPSGVMLDNYKRNPIVCWSHSYNTPEQIIGKNIWIKPDDQGLVAKTAFANNEFADQVYRAYTEDVGGTGPLLRGWSVGFIPVEYETPTKQAKDGPRRIYTKWELLEYSAVAVPCSPESLTMAYEKGIITSEALRQDLGPAPVSEPILEPTAIEERAEIITKPETTEDYHRIPISDGHGDHEIRTITVSEKDGIKALYCIPCKEIITYLFSTDKFTMAEAEAWVEEHKKGLAALMAESYMANYPEGQNMDYRVIPCTYAVHAMGETPVDEVLVKQVPASDLAGEIASLRADVAAILARLQVTPEPVSVDGIAFEPEPDIIIEAEPDVLDFEPSVPVPEKSAEERIDEYFRSADYKKIFNEAIEVALAKLRGKVI